MHNGAIQLIVKPLPPEGWVQVGRVETLEVSSYYRLGELDLQAAPTAVTVCLREAAQSSGWTPDAAGLAGAGRVFAALLKQLYDGRRWRLNLAIDISQASGSPMVVPVRRLAGGDEDRLREGLFAHMTERGLTHAFSLPNPGWPGETYAFMEYWWCPKPALGPVLASCWSHHSRGFVAPWPDRGGLEACFAPGGPSELLDRLLARCRFIYHGALPGSGEGLALLSRDLSEEEVRAALGSRPVREALEQLNGRVSPRAGSGVEASRS